MKIGVISDTHVRFFSDLPANLVKALSEIDLVIHAGDIVTLDVIKGLKTLAPVKAVCGNMDYPEVRAALPDQEIFEAEGRKIGITHGRGGPSILEVNAPRLFNGVDIIIFGHTHIAFNKVMGGVLVFNPGSARDSYGILELGNTIEAKIIRGYF
ncbi:MAG: metallophosphoesterase family protein [Dehalococcoidia bacterium]|nr:metallophosphoesterase family protein [Dehalococcoidia bacterium]